MDVNKNLPPYQWEIIWGSRPAGTSSPLCPPSSVGFLLPVLMTDHVHLCVSLSVCVCCLCVNTFLNVATRWMFALQIITKRFHIGFFLGTLIGFVIFQEFLFVCFETAVSLLQE